jgi:hypothetical protein
VRVRDPQGVGDVRVLGWIRNEPPQEGMNGYEHCGTLAGVMVDH